MRRAVKDKNKNDFNKFVWMTGVILIVIGMIVGAGTLIGYPIYSLAVCQAFSLKWLLWMILKWFLYTEGAALIVMIGYIMAKFEISK